MWFFFHGADTDKLAAAVNAKVFFGVKFFLQIKLARRWRMSCMESEHHETPMNITTLQKLLDDALAVMEPNDPAKTHVIASLNCRADSPTPEFVVSFYYYQESPKREACGIGGTPENALAAFMADYQPPETPALKLARLKAEVAKLEGAVS